MVTKAEPTVNLTLRLPRSLHAAAAALAAREDRTLNDLVVHLLRRASELDDWRRLEEVIAQADRGDVAPLTRDMIDTLRAEVKRGTPADEALARAGF